MKKNRLLFALLIIATFFSQAAFAQGDSPIIPLGPGDSTECIVGTYPSSSYFKVNGVPHRRLHDNVVEGATVEAFFTIPAGSPVATYSLVSYQAPDPTYSRKRAHLQVVFDFETKQLGPGNHSLTVAIPNCYFQVDFVMGCIIEQLGPSNSNNFYVNRLISSDYGGTQNCSNAIVGGSGDGEDDSSIIPLGPGDSTECIVGTYPSSSYFKVNGVPHRRLHDNVVEGATVEVFFTVPTGSPVAAYSLVSYKAPDPTYSRSRAHLQEVFDFETKQLGPGSHTLSVAIPNCYFQVDFVMGCIIEQLGPASTNPENFYVNRLISSDYGGTQYCSNNKISPTQTKLEVNTVTVYPNPVIDEQFKIALPASEMLSTIQITDLTGRIIYKAEVAADKKELELNTKTLGMKPGIYLVNIKGKDKIASHKLMVK